LSDPLANQLPPLEIDKDEIKSETDSEEESTPGRANSEEIN